MGALPPEIVRVLRVFEDVFSERVWDWVQVLVVGAILTPGQRTVAAVPRVLGSATSGSSRTTIGCSTGHAGRVGS